MNLITWFYAVKNAIYLNALRLQRRRNQKYLISLKGIAKHPTYKQA